MHTPQHATEHATPPSPFPDLILRPDPAGDWPPSSTGQVLVGAVNAADVAIAHCVRLGGRHCAPEATGPLVDCVDLGQAAADLDGRRSALAGPLLALCRHAFGRAADVCAGLDDEGTLAWCAGELRQAAAALSSAGVPDATGT